MVGLFGALIRANASAAGSPLPPQVVRLSNPKKTLAEYGVTDASVLQLSDLGPQIGYRTVFVVEYLGAYVLSAQQSSVGAATSHLAGSACNGSGFSGHRSDGPATQKQRRQPGCARHR